MIASVAVVTAVLVPAASAGGAPKANASGEELVSYVTDGKLEVGGSITFQVVCGANCSLTSDIEIVLPGPNAKLPQLTGTFAAFSPLDVVVELNKPARQAIKKNIKKVKLRSDVTATNLVTGEVDADSNTFKLKK